MFKHEVFKEERSTYFANKNPAIYFLPIIPLSIFEIMYFLIPELSMRHHSRSNLIGYTLLEFSDNFFSRHSCKNRNQHFIYIVFQNNVCPINPSRLSDGLKERCASLRPISKREKRMEEKRRGEILHEGTRDQIAQGSKVNQKKIWSISVHVSKEKTLLSRLRVITCKNGSSSWLVPPAGLCHLLAHPFRKRKGEIKKKEGRRERERDRKSEKRWKNE